MRKDVRNEIIRIGGDNINKSEMARIMGCSRQTIYNREERLKNPKQKKEIVRTSKLDSYKEIIDTKVDKYRSKGMNVYKFIKKQGYTGGYGIVRKYIKEHKNEQIKKATIRFETVPGLQAQVDWKESMRLVNKKGETFEINIFLMILGYSRYKYIELTNDRNQKTLFKCMVGAFGYFNGCPKEILFDNMKTVVDKARTTTTKVVFNKRFESFSNDAGFTPLACVGYRPKTKGKVETLARIMERLRPYNEEFETWEDLDKIIKEINEDINNEVVQGVNIVPSNIHEKEKEYLNTLPLWDRLINYYEPEKTYKVSKESMITYKGKKYSVPTYLIGKQVTISEMDSRINIYYNITDFVCQHEISDKYLNYHESDLKEIMKSEAYRNKTDEEIQELIELKKKDLACEIIIELGDKEYWDTKDEIFKKKMSEVYKKQVNDLELLVPNFKVASAIIHYDETSPHMHIVGVPIKEKNKNGMSKQVGKSDVFTKESLIKLQDNMRTLCIEEFNKEYNLNTSLKKKQKGRNRDIHVSDMDNYIEMKKQLEKNSKNLENVNKKSLELQQNSKDIKDKIETLKISKLNKDNYILSKEDKESFIDFINNVDNTNKEYDKIQNLSRTLTNVDDQIKDKNKKIKTLTENNVALSLRVKTLEKNNNEKDKEIISLKNKIFSLSNTIEY